MIKLTNMVRTNRLDYWLYYYAPSQTTRLHYVCAKGHICNFDRPNGRAFIRLLLIPGNHTSTPVPKCP